MGGKCNDYLAKCKKYGYDPNSIISKAVFSKDASKQSEIRVSTKIYTTGKRGKDD